MKKRIMYMRYVKQVCFSVSLCVGRIFKNYFKLRSTSLKETRSEIINIENRKYITSILEKAVNDLQKVH